MDRFKRWERLEFGALRIGTTNRRPRIQFESKALCPSEGPHRCFTCLHTVLSVTATLAAVICATAAHAYVNWFVERGAEPQPNYSVMDPVFMLYTMIAVGMVATSVWLEAGFQYFAVWGPKTA